MATPARFDFIICGGGTAGLVLAARLSENASHSILVVEAGADHAGDPLIETPAAFVQTYGNRKYDWDFKTAPQRETADAVHAWPRGKGLGGSSAINLLNYSHCSRQDLDNWAALGNDGWGFEDLTPYMRRAETVHVASKEASDAFATEWIMPELRGQDGPIQLAFPEGDVTWSQRIVREQAKAMGYPETKDPRGGSSLGLFNQYASLDPKTGTRSYSGNTYLRLARERPNLTVWTGSMVLKVVFGKGEGSGEPVAQGVVVERDGGEIEVHASKEVVLCAGAVQSSQLLELSGVGCATLLERHNIPVVVDNRNVGENLQDHVLVLNAWATKPDVLTNETYRDNPKLLQEAMQLYQTEGKGFFSGVLTATGFLGLEQVAPSFDVQAHLDDQTKLRATQKGMLSAQVGNAGEAVVQFHYGAMGWDPSDRSSLSSIAMHQVPGNYFSILLSLCHPWSRGNVHIADADAHTPPVIDPRYLSNSLDLDILAHGLLYLNKFVNTAPLTDYLQDTPDGEKKGKVPMPGFQTFETLDEARDSVRAHMVSHYHPCGTCAMLPRDDGGVVDSALEVYGTRGLRVVDASIFPMQVQGNIQSVVYAVAEKAADIIKAKYAG